jgi:hypothetical protein
MQIGFGITSLPMAWLEQPLRMNSKSDLPDRLKATGSGLGEASQTEIDRRAAELAQMDGRDTFTDEDLAKAAVELGAHPNGGEAATWDETAEDVGKRARRGRIENDSNLGEELTQQGMDDADHDQRLAASDDETES